MVRQHRPGSEGGGGVGGSGGLNGGNGGVGGRAGGEGGAGGESGSGGGGEKAQVMLNPRFLSNWLLALSMAQLGLAQVSGQVQPSPP